VPLGDGAATTDVYYRSGSHVAFGPVTGPEKVPEVNRMFSIRQSQHRACGRRVSLLIASVAFGVLMAIGTQAIAATFNPNNVCSDGTMRAYDNMSQADVQAFLVSKGGVLKSLVTTDYAGVKKPASQIIFEACRQWHISPTVMLVMLQKEQTLITRTTVAKNTLSRAIGAGCPNGTTNKYPGFGKQMWYGARLLDGYGEGKNGSTIPLYHPGIYYDDIYQHPNVGVYPANIATYKLYVYNPSIGAKAPYGDLSAQSGNLSGNANFWWIHSAWFGDPTADAGHVVYRLFNAKTGNYFYTASVMERYRMTRASFTSQGVAFSWNPTSTANTDAVYRAYNRKKHTYLFTPSAKQYKALTTGKSGKTWRGDGRVFRTSNTKTNAYPVYGFSSKKSGLYFYTSSPREKAKYSTVASRKKWKYRGIMFWMSK